MKESKRLFSGEYLSPVGVIYYSCSENSLVSLQFAKKSQPLSKKAPSIIAEVKSALIAYFKGDFALSNIAYDLVGTEFQCQVWQALMQIQPGETISYSELATRIGKPNAMRAVGAANGANPIAILIPCHRVIGKNQKLAGYAYGIDRKRWLLRHEMSHTPKLNYSLF